MSGQKSNIAVGVTLCIVMGISIYGLVMSSDNTSPENKIPDAPVIPNKEVEHLPTALESDRPLELRALGGDAEAAYTLAESYRADSDSTPEDTMQAIVWFSIARLLKRDAFDSAPYKQLQYSLTPDEQTQLRTLQEQTLNVMEGILLDIAPEDVPALYKQGLKPKEYTLFPKTTLVHIKEATEGGHGSTTRDEYRFASLDPSECEKVRNMPSVSQNNDTYGICIHRMAEITADPSICEYKKNADNDTDVGSCLRWLAYSNDVPDVTPCFLIDRPDDLSMDRSREDYGSFSNCLTIVIEDHPSPEGCALLAKTVNGTTILADKCYLQLLESEQAGIEICSRISTPYHYDYCMLFSAAKTGNASYCNQIQKDNDDIRTKCLAAVGSGGQGSGGCEGVEDQLARDTCYETLSYTEKSYMPCSNISLKEPVNNQPGGRPSRLMCYQHHFFGNTDIDVCLDIELEEAQYYCFWTYKNFPASSSDCEKIDAEKYKELRALCLWNTKSKEGKSVCEKIDPTAVQSDAGNRNIRENCLK